LARAYLVYALALVPLYLVVAAIVADRLKLDPAIPEDKLRELEESIARSEWADMLARRMAATPEAIEMVKRALARRMARNIASTLR